MTVFLIASVSFLINIPFGKWRGKYRKFTMPWWLLIHASIPLLVALRLWLAPPTSFIPLFIALAVLGQFAGQKLSSRIT